MNFVRYLYWFNFKLKYWYNPLARVRKFIRYLRFTVMWIRAIPKVWSSYNEDLDIKFRESVKEDEGRV